MPTTQPVLPLPSSSGSYCVPIPPPIILLPLTTVSLSGWPEFVSLSPLGATTPPSCALILPTLSPFQTPQIRDVAPPTVPWLPDISLCKSSPTVFQLSLVRLPPPVSHMSHILIVSLASPWPVTGTPCVSTLPSLPFTQKGTTSPTHTIELPAPMPCRKFPTPWFLPPPTIYGN